MKKLFLTLVGLIASVSAAFALNPFLEFQPVVAGGNTCHFNIQGGIHEMMSKNVGLGAGIGITEEWTFSQGPLIPIFVRGDFSGQVGSFKPFVSLDLGYAVNTAATSCGAVVVNPMVGLNFGKWYGGIGYEALCWTPKYAGTTSMFNLKVGYNF